MKPSCQRVLDRLRQGPATTHDLCQPAVGGNRFGGRVHELRALGCVIDEHRLRQGSSSYELAFDAERAGDELQPGPLSLPGQAPVPNGTESTRPLSTDGLFDGSAFTTSTSPYRTTAA